MLELDKSGTELGRGLNDDNQHDVLDARLGRTAILRSPPDRSLFRSPDNTGDFAVIQETGLQRRQLLLRLPFCDIPQVAEGQKLVALHVRPNLHCQFVLDTPASNNSIVYCVCRLFTCCVGTVVWRGQSPCEP